MKAHISKGSRFGKAKVIKTDNVIKKMSVLKKLEQLYIRMHELSPEELEEMWPSISQENANDNHKKNVYIKSKYKNKEFLLSLLAGATQTVTALRFANKETKLNLDDKYTQEIIRQQTEEVSRIH